MTPSISWLQSLHSLAHDFCHTVAIIKGPPDIRPWNTNQVIWSGQGAPDPRDPVFAYYHLGEDSQHVAILGAASRDCLARFEEVFAEDAAYRDAYGAGFQRDMLIGLLQLSLPDAPISPVPSPYWKRYVAPAVAQLRAGSPDRYGEAVEIAVRSLPTPHPPTLVVLPLAGVHALGAVTIGGMTMLPEEGCTGDHDLAHCGMFLHRLRELQGRTDHTPVVFAKVTIPAEPGLAVERAVTRTEQLCRMLRLLPNPGLADRPLADPPRIDLDASDSAAFYIAETSIGTYPIPIRRTSSEPQGRLTNWRVEPRLQSEAWRRMAKLIERGATCDVDARLLTALRHLGEAMAETSAASAVVGALAALDALLGPPAGETLPIDLSEAAARLAAPAAQRAELRDQLTSLSALKEQLAHDLDRPVAGRTRAEAVWVAYRVLERLLECEGLVGYRDLRLLLDQLR
jgi:hypothetical protein